MEKKVCRGDSGDQSATGETISSSEYERPFRRTCPCDPGEENLPCIENDYARAKAYLMKQCMSSGDNLWDHLNEVLQKILVERPRDIGCTFEEFSYRVRDCRFRPQTDHLLDVFVPPSHYELAQKLLQLLVPDDLEKATEKTEGDEEEGQAEYDLMETFYYFEQGGVGLPKDEVLCMVAHLKKLRANEPIEKCRFWGKILGTKKNYYVAETEVSDEEALRINTEREEEEERIRAEEEEREAVEREEERLKREAEIEAEREREIQFAAERSEAKYRELLKEAEAKGLEEAPEKVELEPWPPAPPLPCLTIKKSVQCPVEPTGTGANKKVYYVCYGPGEEWVQLPSVTPQQIVAARKIKRAFVGDLEAEIHTYPIFPGKEKNYLRAQIARISAGTQISPLGYYTFNEEEEEEEAEPEPEENKTNYIINPDFEPVAIRDLVDSSMSFWVHHTQYILQQGRVIWWNPAPKEEQGEEEEEAEVEDEEPPAKEFGPALLTPLSEDSALDAVVPWSVRKTSSLFPENAVAIVRSNLWPGAYAFAVNKKFDNIYIGFGHKFSSNNHSPVPMQEIQDEYPLGPEIMEISDPTPEEEEEWRLAHEIPTAETNVEEEEEENDEDEADNEE